MGFLSKIFGSKNVTEVPTLNEQTGSEPTVRDQVPTGVDAWRYQQILSMLESIVHPTVVGDNFIEMFKTIPEVFWPIDYISKRISEAHFDLKRVKDDSLVWCNRLNLDKILTAPNPVMSWRELVYQYFVYKLAY